MGSHDGYLRTKITSAGIKFLCVPVFIYFSQKSLFVSHFPERTDKNCLNCGSEVLGRYCQNCGQENLEPKETFLHLFSHFVNDITHFDGKFFSTLKYLLFRPGFLSAEYVRGRRMSYLHPIRMYVFTSAIFFLIFFAIVGNNMTTIQTDAYAKLYAKREHLVDKLVKTSNKFDRKTILRQITAVDTTLAKLNRTIVEMATEGIKVTSDTVGLHKVLSEIKGDSAALLAIKDVQPDEDSSDDDDNGAQALKSVTAELVPHNHQKDTTEDVTRDTAQHKGAWHYMSHHKPLKVDTTQDKEDSSINNEVNDLTALKDGDVSVNHGLGGEILPKTVEEYDARENLILPANRPPWIDRVVNRKMVEIRQEYHDDKKHFLADVKEKFLHTFPKILFVSLPLIALILRLMNLRRRKQILYVDHGIFTIHLYCASFIIILVTLALDKVKDALGWKWLDLISTLLVLAFFFYEYKALHNFYKQGRAKTLVKMFILNISATILLTILITFFVLLTVFEL